MITVEDALRIALEAHDGQKDLDGNPVILHPMAVGMAGRNREEQVTGLLHDEGMNYEDYVKRIAASDNQLAIRVKYNDLRHNLKRGRAGGHWHIVAKHERALAVIEPLVRAREMRVLSVASLGESASRLLAPLRSASEQSSNESL